MIDDNIVFKIIVLGQQGVGKSSMLMRYIKDEFSQQYNVTVGVEFASQLVSVNQKTTVKLQIWDTAGQEAFRAIVRSFYKGIAGVFLSFAIDNQDSFEALRTWVKQVRDNGHQQVVFFLVGTRADLQANRRVSTQKADAFLKQIGGYFYIETSAKTGINVGLLFQKAAKIMHKKYISNGAFRNLVRPVMCSGIDMDRAQSFTLQNTMTQNSKKKKKCC